jgi:type IV secretion system protein VirB6
MPSTIAFAETIEERDQAIKGYYDGLTCGDGGIGDLFRSQFSHTCVTAPFLDVLVQTIVNPVFVIQGILKVKMHADFIPGNDELEIPDLRYTCKRENRVDYHDPKISFAVCNDRMLREERSKTFFNSIAAAMAGKGTAEAIRDSWSIPREKFHNVYKDISAGEIVRVDDDIPMRLKVITDRDQICIAHALGNWGWTRIGCRYMKEPFPDSIYDINPEMKGLMNCPSNERISCYDRAKSNGANMTSISGPIVTCVREMLIRLVANPSYCGEEDQQITQTLNNSRNIFFKFQKNMYVAVSTLLTLYIIFVALNMLLGGEIPKKSELIIYVIKFILVVYFSVGINTNHERHGFDGMTEWVFPVLFNGASQLSSWIFSADASGLCRFTADDYRTSLGGFWNLYSIWDALDCRVLHYLGLNFMSDTSNSSSAMNFSIPPYLLFLLAAIFIGSFQLVMLSLAYPLLVISVAAYYVNSFLISLIMIVILGVMAPIFVPMALFDFTKGFFTSWAKLLISFTLQPIVVATFLSVMFAVYEQAYYTSCKYKFLTTFKKVPVTGEVVAKKVFFIDMEPASYESQEKLANCVASLGGLLNSVQSATYNAIAVDQTGRLNNFVRVEDPVTRTVGYRENAPSDFNQVQGSYTDSFDNDLPKSSPLSESTKKEKGVFVAGTVLIFEKIRDLIYGLFTCCVVLYLMRHFADQLSGFAADVTEGVSSQSSTIAPTTIYNKTNEAAAKAYNMAGKLGGGGGGGGSGSNGTNSPPPQS